MRAGLLLSLAALAAAPPPADAPAEFRSRCEALREKEKTYWDGFQTRFSAALVIFDKPWQKAHYDPSAPQDQTWDWSAILRLYGDFVTLEEERAAAAEALASSGHAGAAAALFGELMETAKRADGAEEQLDGKMPFVGLLMCDQRPAVLRHGLGRYEKRLLPALARCPGAVALLCGDGWKRAVEGDGRASILRRTAVLDALGLSGDSAAAGFLGERAAAKASSIRIAALEALLRLSPAAGPALLPLLEDPSPVVRYALLQDLRRREKPDPRWIRPVGAAYLAAKGRLRTEALETLRVLAHRPLGDEPEKWKEWLAANQAALDAGTFAPEGDPPARSEAAANEKEAKFYGIPVPTRGAVFAVEGTYPLHWPADVDIQRTRHSARWPVPPKAGWDGPPPVHHGILLRQVQRAVAALPTDALFGLLSGSGKCDALLFEDGRMTRASPAAAAEAAKFVERLDLPGYCGTWEMLRESMRIAGLDPSPGAADFPAPRADTVFLFHVGSPMGGRFVGAEPVVEAFLRLNRFRRMTVNAIRIACEQEQAEEVMKGFADGSGGVYRWQAKPPVE
jgi:hypothetical protein